MPKFMKKASRESEIKKALNPYVREWFFSRFEKFSEPQKYGVMEVHNKNNILISAPTGTGKTLTSTLAVINELVNMALTGILEDKVYCVYINPLKSLSRDIEVNLQIPLEEIKEIAKKDGKKIDIRIGARTGDTTAAQKAKMLKKPPHILITTPESLALMISSSKFRENMREVKYVIIDEAHALAENKRGVHLSLSLERLQDLNNDEITRIGLSATISPLEEVAKYLVGIGRECKIADVHLEKKFDFKIMTPTEDLINTTEKKLHESLYRVLDDLIQKHRSTLVFTNTRAGTERIVHHLKQKFPKKYTENIGAHHGSLSKRVRHSIEDRMRQGKLKAVVCSTSLELGIDIGYIDLVICIGSPKSIARLLQRFGRSGHKLHDTVKGRIIVLDRDDLIECSVMLKHALEKKIDRIHIPRNALDVLAQQVHGMAVSDRWNVREMYKLIRKSYCYQDLGYEDFMEIIRYLAGEYTSLEDRYIYAKIWYDEEHQEVGRRGVMSRVLHMTNIGTIPDETAVIVKIGENVVGTLDEGFLERLRRGDIFVLGGDTYEFLYSRGMVAQVRAAAEKTPTVPSWFSEMLPLSFDLAMEIQKFKRYVEDYLVNERSKKEVVKFIKDYLYVGENVANAVYNYLREQYLYAELPNDKKIILENYNDDEKKYVIFHTNFGRRVNDVLSRAVGYALGKIHKRDVEIGISDNGFYVASKKNMQAGRAFKMINAKNLREVMERAIEKTEVLKRRFRHCATRSLMILRQYKGKRKRVGKQQVSSMILLNAVKRISEEFAILKEARREVLEDLMDIENAEKVFEWIKDRTIEVKEIDTTIPSPFAFNLVLQGYMDVMKMEEKVEFLKRMHHMVVAKIGKKHKI